MKPRYTLARKTARDLLSRMGVTGPPVDPVRIAKALGISVVNVDPPEESVSGFLIREDPESRRPIIGINRHHHPLRRRFTVAHELGHYLLDHEGDWHVDNLQMSRRDERASAGEHAPEIEANQFAAALLMPRLWLAKDLEGQPLDLRHEDELIELAQRYRVSTQAMTYRLVNLDLLD